MMLFYSILFRALNAPQVMISLTFILKKKSYEIVEQKAGTWPDMFY